MKRTFKYIAVLSLTFLLSSCGNDWLNLEKDDSFSAKPEDLTLVNLVSMQTGMYNAIQTPYSGVRSIGEFYYGARMIYDGDVRGDDFQYREGASASADESFLYAYALNNAEGCWEPAYYLIKTANAIIAANPKIAVEQQKVIDDIRGQAYMLRALAHFDILRNYGEFYDIDSQWGIPIIDRVIPGSELATNKPQRSTVKEVYNKILEDLLGTEETPGAIKLMENGTITAGFVNKWAAKALLCRVYLYMGENQKCLDVANDIIQNKPSRYSLWANKDYVSSWSKKEHSEALFEIINVSDDNLGRNGIGYLMYPAGGDIGYGDVIATLQYTSLFEDGDVRKQLFFEDKKAKENNPVYGKKVFMHKYPGTSKSLSGEGYDNATTSIQVLRLSEVYLNAAEAAQKLGNAQADELLTTIVQRANPAAPAVSGANLERVLLERRKELGGEGFRFYDALRNNKTMYRDNVAEYMKEIAAAGVTVVIPDGTQTMNESLHPVLGNENLAINRNHRKIIYPIPPRELNVINTGGEVLVQYYKW